jgi:large subunit ribosomal protein L18e
MKIQRKTNPHLVNLISDLKKASYKEKTNLWKAIAKELEKSTRKRRVVNISKIEKYVNKGETALVPGKVLSVGSLTKPLTVAALQFSETAKAKINKTGKAISIPELIKENPKGKNVRIIG